MSNQTRERLRHGVRTAVGCAVGYTLARWLDLQAGQWVVITVALVMLSEQRTGGLLRKSVQRFWGTVLGAAGAVLMLFVLPGGHPWSLLWALPALVAFGFLAADAERSYIGVLGAVTLVMVGMEPDGNVDFAARRIAQIMLGLAVALVVSQVVLPDHARNRLRQAIASFVQGLADMAVQHEDRDEIEPRLVALLAEQRKLVAEALAEGEKAGRKSMEELMLAERRAFRYLFILSQVPGNSEFLPRVSKGLQSLADGGSEPVEWPEAEFSSDPVHRLAGQRLVESCRSLEECLRGMQESA